MKPDLPPQASPFAAPPAFTLSRRQFITASALAGGSLMLKSRADAAEAKHAIAADTSKALIAITLDMEMSRNFPVWEDTHWDYEKGVLNEETKRYCVEAARRVKARGGMVHFFCVGRVLEQENVDWLKELVREGHPIGKHTYDHVYVLAQKPDDIQFRFKRAFYPTGLIDVPMSPISDVAAFRGARWKLDSFLKAIRLGVEWAIETHGVFDLLSHPSVLYPMDPEFKTVELVCDLVKKAGQRAALVDLDSIALRTKLSKGRTP